MTPVLTNSVEPVFTAETGGLAAASLGGHVLGYALSDALRISTSATAGAGAAAHGLPCAGRESHVGTGCTRAPDGPDTGGWDGGRGVACRQAAAVRRLDDQAGR